LAEPGSGSEPEPQPAAARRARARADVAMSFMAPMLAGADERRVRG
jgi:hypothetical protein